MHNFGGVLSFIEGGRKGGPKTAQKYAKKTHTASDFFPSTETSRVHRGHNMKAAVSKTCKAI